MDELDSQDYDLDIENLRIKAMYTYGDALFQNVDWGDNFDARIPSPAYDLENAPYSLYKQPISRSSSFSSSASFGSMDSGVSVPPGKGKKRKRVANIRYSQVIDESSEDHETKEAHITTNDPVSMDYADPGKGVVQVSGLVGHLRKNTADGFDEQAAQNPSGSISHTSVNYSTKYIKVTDVTTEEIIRNPLSLEQGPGHINQESTDFLACPWYRMYSEHQLCCNVKLPQAKDVVLHIQRCHLRAGWCCPFCDAPFVHASLYHYHMSARNCESRSTFKRSKTVGISLETFRLLRCDSTKSEVENWYNIWDIIFEDTPRPVNPYLGNMFEESFGVVESCWKRQADDIIRMTLHDQQKLQVRELPGIVSRLLRELRLSNMREEGT